MPKPAFPGLRLHVVDELGQRRTFVSGASAALVSPRKGEAKPLSPRAGTLPLVRGALCCLSTTVPLLIHLIPLVPNMIALTPLVQELEVRAKTRASEGAPGGRGSPRRMVAMPLSGQHALQGHRENMEDAHVWLDWLRDDVPTLSWEARWAFYSVYDGHGGPECAHALRPIVHRNVVATPEFAAGNVLEALKAGFAEVRGSRQTLRWGRRVVCNRRYDIGRVCAIGAL